MKLQFTIDAGFPPGGKSRAAKIATPYTTPITPPIIPKPNHANEHKKACKNK
jgi:hypothetical protein